MQGRADIVDLGNRFEGITSTATNANDAESSARMIAGSTDMKVNVHLGSNFQLSSVLQFVSDILQLGLFDVRRIWNCIKSYCMVNANSKDGFSSMSGHYPDRSIRSFSTASSVFHSASGLLFHSQNGLSFSALSFDTKGLSSVSISSNQGAIGSNHTPHPFSTESFASSPFSDIDWNTRLMNLYQLPLTFSTGESKCSFVLNGTSLRLYEIDYPSYSFSSDDDCDKRNRRIDAQILAEEKE